MKEAVEFQLADTPLERGVTLIEASAGTGKTYTLAGLVLRLIIEEHLTIEKILAVTYTVAATEELRDRVRSRLREALDDLQRGQSGDPIITKFLITGDVARAVRELDVAIASFDEARIFTIHGFCQRVLHDHAFESGTMFESELLADPRALFDEVARDFWRRKIYGASPLLARLALARGLDAGEWSRLLGSVRNHPGLRIVPEPERESCDALAKQLEVKFASLADEWKRSADAVGVILRESKALSRNRQSSSFSPEEVETILAGVTALFADLENTPPESLAALETLASSNIVRCTKPKGEPPRHSFFDLCEEFTALASGFVNQLAHEFIAFAGREVTERKARRNALTYDDLLTRLRDALDGTDGEPLARKLGASYGAALIDEFQDTDSVQYEIFHRAFGGGGHHLLFIGDPKQAIYGFRGADVLAYLRAAGAASRRYTLKTNFRSEKPLLDGVNTLFDPANNPFLIDAIQYVKVRAPDKPRASFKSLVETAHAPPLRFRLLKNDREEVFGKTAADDAIRAAVVADIARLRAGGALLGGGALRLRDMAVLVRTKFQARELQAALRDAGIKSVLQTDESVFHTDEARELQRFLDGVLEPGREPLLKSALATSLVGLNAAEILALDASDATWQERGEKFLDWHERWARDGFVTMFRRLLVDQRVRERLVGLPGGERRLTNFLHLAELLHCEEAVHRLAPDALCAWLRGQRAADAESADEFQIRLESDGDAVLISTIHKSKGLEYPVVFCPFLWRTIDIKHIGRDVLFHDEAQRMTLDLRGSKDAPADAVDAWKREQMQESMRLLYVAITRAQNRCILYAGCIKEIEQSALGHLLDIATPEAITAAVEKITDESKGTIGVTAIDPDADAGVALPRAGDDAAEELRARIFHGAISQTAMIASFTGLTSDRAEEAPDRDALAVPVEGERETDPLAMFLPGARTGLFFHDVLETLDFQDTAAIEPAVAKTLAAHGIAATGARDAACAQLRRLVGMPLAPGVALNRVAPTERLAEVEFVYPIRSLRPDTLRGVFAKHGGPTLPAEIPASLGRLRFQPVDGFMRGFMDLLFRADGKFWLVDWKTNALDSYEDPGMRASMAQHCYHLQYHLYTVAVDLFLKTRVRGYDYARDFGGVFYIFLRGVDPARPERAIFRDKPAPELVRALRETLIGGQS